MLTTLRIKTPANNGCQQTQIEIADRHRVKLYTNVCGCPMVTTITRSQASEIVNTARNNGDEVTRKVLPNLELYPGYGSKIDAIIYSGLADLFSRDDWSDLVNACVDQGA